MIEIFSRSRTGNVTNAHRAERILSHSTRLLPDYPSADFNRGLAFSTMGNKTEAIRLMQVALSKNIDSQANVYAYMAQEMMEQVRVLFATQYFCASLKHI